MVDFETPLGLRSDNQFWNISVVNQPGESNNGNLAFTPNSLLAVNPVLEIDDENGHIGLGDRPSASIRLSVSPSTLDNIGIFANANGTTIAAFNPSSTGIAGLFVSQGRAGVFNGDVEINGELITSSLSLRLDDPLDPANKILSHTHIGSSEMLNVYSGNVVLNENGEAWVELPEWVEALNSDFRYQLTCIGRANSVYIAEEVSSNRFKIAGGSPQMKVSWQLTGIRKDPWAQAHPLVVEEEKPSNLKGYYLHPDLYDCSQEKSISFAQYPEVMELQKKDEEKHLVKKN